MRISSSNVPVERVELLILIRKYQVDVSTPRPDITEDIFVVFLSTSGNIWG
jgi:hypothetical protein